LNALQAALPWALIILRVLLCPLIVLGASRSWSGTWLAAIVLAALLSDAYDGILARRWAGETPTLRVSDSIADTIFYLGVVWALWLRDPQVLRGNWIFFAALFALEGFRYVFDLFKYRRTASYHSYLAKFWGLLIAVTMVGVFAFNGFKPLVRAALIVGIIVNLEGVAMSLLLPRWKNDVKTLERAWQLRKAMLAEQSRQH